MPNWEDHLNEDEQIALLQMREELEVARKELLNSKRKFDRICDDIYLLSKKVREQVLGGPPNIRTETRD